MKKIYDFEKNRLLYKRKQGQIYDLELRKPITVIEGESGFGKSLLVNELKNLKGLQNVSEYESSNVCIVSDDSIKNEFPNNGSLVIIDRADFLLTDKICERILDDIKDRFLLFGRKSQNLYLSPNNFGYFIQEGNCIKIKYYFNEKGWFQ